MRMKPSLEQREPKAVLSNEHRQIWHWTMKKTRKYLDTEIYNIKKKGEACHGMSWTMRDLSSSP